MNPPTYSPLTTALRITPMTTDRKPRRWVKTFKPEFADAVKNGTKRQTIRPMPAREQDCPQVGDILDARMWEGHPYRSKMRKLRTGRIVRLAKVQILPELPIVLHRLQVEGLEPVPADLDAFARADGFKDWPDMRAWFHREHGLPFTGILIQWDPINL
jgi:hypothetical protein